MGDPTSNSGRAASVRSEGAHSDRQARTLLDRLRNDRFSKEEHADDRYAQGWNASSDNAIAIVERWLCEQADARPLVEIGLRELCENAPKGDE